MNISQEKEKIQEIIRRSSVRNYFTPMLPKQHKPRRIELPKKLEKMTLNLEKLTLKLLIPPKSLTQEPISKPQKSKARNFIQLSSKLLNFPENQAKHASNSSLQKSLEVKNMNQAVSQAKDNQKPTNSALSSIIYESRPRETRRYTFSKAKHFKSESQKHQKAFYRNDEATLNIFKTGENDEEVVLEAWSHDYFPEI